MKKITCEMCGGTDLIKQDGVFVCQNCGMKYSLEDAKKLMIEGVVEVQGTVKVDQSDELKNLYVLARRAKNNQENETAAKYYDMILVKEPKSWEAAFYSVYCKALLSKSDQFKSAVTSLCNNIDVVLTLIKRNVSGRDEQKKAYREIANKVTDFVHISYWKFGQAKERYLKFNSSINDRTNLDMSIVELHAAARYVHLFGDKLNDKFGDDPEARKISCTAWKKGIDLYKETLSYLKGAILVGPENKEDRVKYIIETYAEKIKKYDSTYVAPEVDTSSGGCYVATAVYGSYDCPQVWTLRRFRDYTLAETWYGRAFVHMYYAVSPALVKWFGHTEWFKKFWKGKLDRMVARLQSDGVESTPYEDRVW